MLQQVIKWDPGGLETINESFNKLHTSIIWRNTRGLNELMHSTKCMINSRSAMSIKRNRNKNN